MLRNLGIRWQILAALALPVLLLGLVSSQVTYRALVDMRQANQSRELAQASSRFGVLINGLSAERALSQAVLAGTPGARPQLKASRASVDRDLRAIRSQLYATSYADGDVQRLLDHLAAVHATIPGLRAQVDSGKAGPKTTAARYSQVIAADVDLPFDLADTISDPGQAANFRAAGQLDTALEALAQEQITGASVIAAGRLSINDQRELGADQSTAQRALADFRRTAEPDQSSALTAAFADPAARSADLATARTALTRAGTGNRPTVRAGTWSAATNGQIQAVRGVFNLLSSDGVEQATADYAAARKKLQLTLAAAVGVTLLTLLLALGLSRRICAPLGRLTLAATAIRDQLPQLVENLQADRHHEFQLHVPAVSTVGSNEVSRLAAAFVDVNAVTVQVARKQARLRAAVGDMFVNVARRNQVLLARQLAFIDQLERTEADPDSLQELFRLDHLATRMRRNAESLLILAGLESGRRLREPMPLSDVIRTATSQIEHYPRVSLSLDVDPLVYAHLALPVAHLLAELLENATNFSDPASTVLVEAVAAADGLRITVTDEGLGMSTGELDQIRLRLNESPTAETLSSQRLGFFVVGQLAQRLDAKVRLTSQRARGTAVAIDLPISVFAPGGVQAAGTIAVTEGGGFEPSLDGTARPGPAATPAPAPAADPIPASASVFVSVSDSVAPGTVPVELMSADSELADPLSQGPIPMAAEPTSSTATPLPVQTGAVPKPLPMPGPMPIPPSFDYQALAAAATAEPAWVPQTEPQDAAVPGLPLARRVVVQVTDDDDERPHGYSAHRGHELHHDHEHHFHPLGPPPPPLAPGEELRMRKLLGAVDVLPVSRTSIRAALRKGRRATDVAMGRTRLDEFDPLGVVREFALREGFIDSAMAQPDVPSQPTSQENGEAGPSGSTGLGYGPAPEPRAGTAADALTEFGRATAYQPESVADLTPGGLQRRSPNPIPPAEMAPSTTTTTTTGRPRTAAGVRAMLSGFRSGAERGRTSPSASRHVQERETDDPQQPDADGGSDQ